MKTKYKFSIFISVLIFIVSIGTTVYAAVSYLYLNIEGNSQSTDYWCWAASSQTIIDYLNPGIVSQGQYQIVSEVKGCVFYDQRDAASDSDITKALTSFGLSTKYTASAIPYSTVVDNIKGWYSPMEVAVTYKNPNVTLGHAMVICGYYQDSSSNLNEVKIMDPWPSSTRFSFMTYSSFVTNSNWNWTSTWYYNRKI